LTPKSAPLSPGDSRFCIRSDLHSSLCPGALYETHILLFPLLFVPDDISLRTSPRRHLPSVGPFFDVSSRVLVFSLRLRTLPWVAFFLSGRLAGTANAVAVFVGGTPPLLFTSNFKPFCSRLVTAPALLTPTHKTTAFYFRHS